MTAAIVLAMVFASLMTLLSPSAAWAADIAGMSVFLDSGRGGISDSSIPKQVSNGRGGTKDRGTTGTSTSDGYPEHSFNWDVAPRVRSALTLLGVHTEMSRAKTIHLHRVKVPTPCSSCRSGTAGPDGDGEGANHTPPPPGSSIEVCEGPHGHHFCLSTSRVVPSCRRDVRHHPQDRQDGSSRSSKPRDAAPPRAERAHNYDAVTELVAERVEKSQGRMSAKRMLPIARAAGYDGFGTQLPPPGRRGEGVVAQRTSPWTPPGGVVTG